MQQMHTDQSDSVDIDEVEDLDRPVQADELSADDIEIANFAFSARGYDRAEVNDFLQKVAQVVRSHEQAYAHLGQDVGEILQQARDSANRFLGEARSRAAALNKQAVEEAERIEREAQDKADKLQRESQRQARKTRREADKEAAQRMNEAAERVRSLDKLEADALERLASLHRQLVELGDKIQRLEPVEDQRPGADILEAAEKEAAILELDDEVVEQVEDADVEDDAVTTDLSNGRPRVTGAQTSPAPAANVPEPVPERTPSTHTGTPTSSPSELVSPAGARSQITTELPAPTTPVPESPSPWAPNVGPQHVHRFSVSNQPPAHDRHQDDTFKEALWAGVAGVSGLAGIVGFLAGLIITLVEDGGFVGPVILLLSFAALGVATWGVVNHLGPSTLRGFRRNGS